MNPENREPTYEEIVFLSYFDFYYLGKSSNYKSTENNDWLFKYKEEIYDLSAADLTQLEIIKAKKLFLVT